jgi:hypothetical protein
MFISLNVTRCRFGGNCADSECVNSRENAHDGRLARDVIAFYDDDASFDVEIVESDP